MRKHSILAWSVWTYVALIVFWLLLRALFFDAIWWLALLNTVAVYLFLPLPPLLAAALLRRRRLMLAGLAIPVAAFGALFGALLLPDRPPQPGGGPLITAVSFNVLTSNRDVDAIGRAIGAAQPDIVGLQELTPKRRAGLKAALGNDLPYHTLDRSAAFGNIGLMSRYPIAGVAPIALPTMQPALHAIVDVRGQLVHVFVAHLSPNHLFKNPTIGVAEAAAIAYARRAAEVARLREEIAGLREPAVLLCDCNLTDSSHAYARLHEFLADSFREAGWGLRHTNYTSGVPFPTQRIDYVWHSAGLTAMAAEVGQPGGSDHLPVVVRLKLLDPAAGQSAGASR